jgi:membrane-associated phospholipid phosphatase
MTSHSELAAAVGAAAHPTPGGGHVRRRRRPSGEPPPLPRQLSRTGWYWLALATGVLSFWVVLVLTGGTTVRQDAAESHLLNLLATVRNAPFTAFFRTVEAAIAPVVLLTWWASLVVMVIWRRWRHLFVWVGAMLLVSVICTATSLLIQRPRPLNVDIIGHWQGFAMPSRPMAILAATGVNVLYAIVPHGPLRQRGKVVVTVVLAVAGFGRLYLGVEHPSDVVVAVILGVAVPLALWRLLVPNDVFPVTYRRGRTAHLDVGGRRGEAIVAALHDQLGLVATGVKPFGLEGSGGSTPLRITVKGDPDSYLFCKLYAITHLRSDRWYKLGRTLLYGRLEDEKPFNTVRRLVQYEDYVLRVMYAAGLPVPAPAGFVEITPEREYMLCSEFFDNAQEIGEIEVDTPIIDQGLTIVRRLWEAGLAHRDIKPANLLVRDGQVLLIDSAFAEVRPTPWRQAVDLANMMLVMALRCGDCRLVYERARLQFSDEEIAEAFAATRGLTMPSQLRRMIRQHGRDLHAEFTQLLPVRLPPVRIQHWSIRRVMLLIVVLVGVVLASSVVAQLLRSPL